MAVKRSSLSTPEKVYQRIEVSQDAIELLQERDDGIIGKLCDTMSVDDNGYYIKIWKPSGLISINEIKSTGKYYDEHQQAIKAYQELLKRTSAVTGISVDELSIIADPTDSILAKEESEAGEDETKIARLARLRKELAPQRELRKEVFQDYADDVKPYLDQLISSAENVKEKFQTMWGAIICGRLNSKKFVPDREDIMEDSNGISNAWTPDDIWSLSSDLVNSISDYLNKGNKEEEVDQKKPTKAEK